MLTWPLQEVVEEETIERANGGPVIIRRVIKPVKWDMDTAIKAARIMALLRDRAVIDGTYVRRMEEIDPKAGRTVAGTFTLYESSYGEVHGDALQPGQDRPAEAEAPMTGLTAEGNGAVEELIREQDFFG